jgi:hypothetical protein
LPAFYKISFLEYPDEFSANPRRVIWSICPKTVSGSTGILWTCASGVVRFADHLTAEEKIVKKFSIVSMII